VAFFVGRRIFGNGRTFGTAEKAASSSKGRGRKNSGGKSGEVGGFHRWRLVAAAVAAEAKRLFADGMATATPWPNTTATVS